MIVTRHEGDPVRMRAAFDSQDEAKFVAEQIKPYFETNAVTISVR
jgi:hypothetical protein